MSTWLPGLFTACVALETAHLSETLLLPGRVRGSLPGRGNRCLWRRRCVCFTAEVHELLGRDGGSRWRFFRAVARTLSPLFWCRVPRCRGQTNSAMQQTVSPLRPGVQIARPPSAPSLQLMAGSLARPLSPASTWFQRVSSWPRHHVARWICAAGGDSLGGSVVGVV